jgi:hypothetical protein
MRAGKEKVIVWINRWIPYTFFTSLRIRATLSIFRVFKYWVIVSSAEVNTRLNARSTIEAHTMKKSNLIYYKIRVPVVVEVIHYSQHKQFQYRFHYKHDWKHDIRILNLVQSVRILIIHLTTQRYYICYYKYHYKNVEVLVSNYLKQLSFKLVFRRKILTSFYFLIHYEFLLLI